jgi:hypothetical protein
MKFEYFCTVKELIALIVGRVASIHELPRRGILGNPFAKFA